jgi:PQQ-dependent catabolism-associated beta-propeller protein
MFSRQRVKGIYLGIVKTFRASSHRVFSLVSALVLACCVAQGAARAAESLVYVSLEEGGEVVAIDPASATIVARIPVGKRPRGVKISPDGKRLYVALSGSPRAAPGSDESKLPPADRAADGVGVVDLGTHKLLRTLPSGQDPESFDVSRDGRTLYVSNEETAEMSVLDLASGKIKHKVEVGHEPEGVTISPDGKVVYVTSEQDNLVVAVATGSYKVLAQLPTGPRPRSVSFTHDGATAFVTSENGAQVNVLDAAHLKPEGTIKVEAKAKTPLGPRPMGSALSPDGQTLYVSLGRGEGVAVIDVATRKVTRLIDGVGARPWGIGVSHDGARVYTANGSSNDVSIIDAATGKVTTRVKVGGLPWGLAVAPAPKGKP